MIAASRIAGLVITVAVLAAFGWIGRYAEAAAPEAPALGRAATLAASCGGCHARDGGAIVGLDTRDAGHIQTSLMAYKADAQGTSVMHRIARGYSEADIRMIAAYLAARDGR
ncbi:cytochrome C [Iodidimonas sp. SYSU 1G8]|uniref:c-type cytochrome n=1 Tax=Iodidimonas sp. SYSU 1G8 TaxID=3133967 RepID=UPI0031FF0FE7